MFGRWFRKTAATPPEEAAEPAEAAAPVSTQAEPAEELVVVPMPPLVSILLSQREVKGAELTEDEVLTARDTAISMTMSRSRAEALARSRGFADLDPTDPWPEWQRFIAEYREDEGPARTV